MGIRRLLASPEFAESLVGSIQEQDTFFEMLDEFGQNDCDEIEIHIQDLKVMAIASDNTARIAAA